VHSIFFRRSRSPHRRQKTTELLILKIKAAKAAAKVMAAAAVAA
jgi:hypothetical protein